MPEMSMHGKVVVVTGANVGIGLETAVGVAERGATRPRPTWRPRW
jgi:NAD(P)-dependent dehydrogenase (short-subunit alcohol dehydrogenase family)